MTVTIANCAITPAGGLLGSGSVGCCSGEFISPYGGVKPPLHRIGPLPSFWFRERKSREELPPSAESRVPNPASRPCNL